MRRYRNEIFTHTIEQIVSRAADRGINLSHSSLKAYNNTPVQKVTITDHNKFVSVDIFTDTYGKYYYNPTIDEDYSFNSISAQITRRSIRDEKLSHVFNDGCVTMDRMSDLIRYVVDRIESLIDDTMSEIDRSQYVCGVFNTRELELFKNNNLNIDTSLQFNQKVDRVFQYTIGGNTTKRKLTIQKLEDGYKMDIDEASTIKTKFGNSVFNGYEKIYEIPPGEKNSNDFIHLFTRVYEY